MAAITAANVIVTLNQDDIDRSPDGRVGIRTFPTVAFGNAALTYPALGIPMPAIGNFGFHFAIKEFSNRLFIIADAHFLDFIGCCVDKAHPGSIKLAGQKHTFKNLVYLVAGNNDIDNFFFNFKLGTTEILPSEF
jgi:hypothetical protein